MPFKDSTARREYYENHREQQRKYSAASYARNREKVLARGHGLLKRYSQMQRSAARRGIPCGLTLQEYSKLTGGAICTYCGGGLPKSGSGIDRKNSYTGYSEENCVPCCTNCNAIRGKDLISHSEMIEVANLLKRLRGES